MADKTALSPESTSAPVVEAPAPVETVVGPSVEDLDARVALLERYVVQLRRVLRDYYDIDGKGQVG